MSFATMGVIGLALYLLVLLVVAEFARRARRDSTPADHVLAARELGVFVLFLTLYATAYSGNSLLGYPGKAYRSGFSFIMATGFMMAIIVMFHALVPKLRPLAIRHEFVTPGDWVRHRFGDEPMGQPLLLGVGVLMTLALANFLFAQLKAMGEMVDAVTAGGVSYEWGVVGLAAMVLFYETRGGMRAVAWTDAAQGVLMMVGLASMLVWLLTASGGLSQMTEQILQIRPEAAAVPDAAGCANWFTKIVLLGVASVVYPQAIQRIYAGRSGGVLKRSLALMAFMPLATTLVVTLIGLATIPRFIGLEGAAADQVMPLLLGEWAEAGAGIAIAAVVVFIAALAAIMSTADSVLLSFGSIVICDLLGKRERDAQTTRLAKAISIGVTAVLVAVVINTREVTLWRLIEIKMELLIQCAPAFLIALNWRGLRAGPAFAGLAVGSAIVFGALAMEHEAVAGFGIGVISLGVNVAIAVGGSLLPGRVAESSAESAEAPAS